MEVDELDDAIFINNSGLVILAPFLPRYFDLLGMVKDRAFVDEQAAIRAVQLLQYLVSGQSETEEYLLVFNKVLCGLPISTPVPASIELSEQELEISRQLLHSVLQNWDKMSNSSVDNLRGSFLLRDGRLDESDDKWQLIVESAGYDVILSFLPWTISIISLPWMEKQLYVDWSTQIS
jgi:hypothetical protein